MEPDTSPAVVTQAVPGFVSGDAVSNPEPKYLGVQYAEAEGSTYRALLDSVPTTDGSQGSFLVQGLPTASQAARLYDCAVIAIIGPDFVTVGSNVNFQPSSYASKEITSACQQLLQQNPTALVEPQYLPAGYCPPAPAPPPAAAAIDAAVAISPTAASREARQSPARATSSSSNPQQQPQQQEGKLAAAKVELSEDGSSALTSSGAAAAAAAAAATKAGAASTADVHEDSRQLQQQHHMEASVSGAAQLTSSDDEADVAQPYAQQLRMLHQQRHPDADLPLLRRGAGSCTGLDQDMRDADAWGWQADGHMDAAGQGGCSSDDVEFEEAGAYEEADPPSPPHMHHQHVERDDEHAMYRMREQYPGQYSGTGQYRQYGQPRVQRLADLQLLHARLPPHGRLPAKRSHQALLDLVQQEQQQVEQQRDREERLLARRTQQQQQQGLPQPKRRRKGPASLAPPAHAPGAAAVSAAAGAAAEEAAEDDEHDEQGAAAVAVLPLLGGGLSLPSSSATGGQPNLGGAFGVSSSGRGRGRGRGGRGRGRHSGRFSRGGAAGGGRGGRGAFTAAHAQAVAAAEQAAGGALPPPGGDRGWLYELLRAEHLFTPCPACSQAHKGWAVLLSYFDPEQPGRSYCGYCPEIAGLPRLLKVKRQGGALLCLEPEVLAGVMDVGDIQRYVVAGNKSKLVYLHPRPAKGVSFGKPAAVCGADGCGRGLLDAHNKYCSVVCKLSQEDEDFAEEHWPALQEKAQAAADAAAAEAAAAAAAAAAAEADKACRQAAAKAKAKAKASAVAAAAQQGAEGTAGGGDASVTGSGGWHRDQHSKQAAAAMPKLGRKSAHKYAKYGGLPVLGGPAQEPQQPSDNKQQLELKAARDQHKQQQPPLPQQQQQQQQQQHLQAGQQQLSGQRPAVLGQQQLLQVWPQQLQQQIAKLEAQPAQQPGWIVISRPLPAAATAAAAAGSGAGLQLHHQQQLQLQLQQRQPSLGQRLPVTTGLVLPPAGSLPAAAAAAAAPPPPPATLLTSPQQQQQQQQQQQRPRWLPPRGAPPAKLWLHELVSCGYLLKPCPLCTGARKGRSSTGRDKLIRYFDPVNPAKGYCNYCPELPNLMHGLLHISRAQQVSSDFHFVRAGDVTAICDAGGVQQYPLNGQAVLYLRPRPQQNRGYRLPGRCVADGRALRDASCRYCSLRCKLAVEDETFRRQYMAPEELAELQHEAAAAAADAAGCAAGGSAAACAAAGPGAAATGRASGSMAGGGSRGGVVQGGGAAAPGAAAAASEAVRATASPVGAVGAVKMEGGNGSCFKAEPPAAGDAAAAAAAAPPPPPPQPAAPAAPTFQPGSWTAMVMNAAAAGSDGSGGNTRVVRPGTLVLAPAAGAAANTGPAAAAAAAAAAENTSAPAAAAAAAAAAAQQRSNSSSRAASSSSSSSSKQMLQRLQLQGVSSAGSLQQLQVGGSEPGGQAGTVLLIPVSQLQSGSAAAAGAGAVASTADARMPPMQVLPQQQQVLPLPGQMQL
ncbi:hypothetical protein COO60DRAFT_1700967 [Scenedesmus sp. NREL 46B-D3]|nr:hypothetical protein COO60DRAFT_1700967 [Scenedesmus sp. NREL 46B-D3]